MDQDLVFHHVPTITKTQKFCKQCTRKVNTGYCWQHYPQITKYDNIQDLQNCIRKLLLLKRMTRQEKFTNVLSMVIGINKDFCKHLACENLKFTEPDNSKHYWIFPTSRREKIYHALTE